MIACQTRASWRIPQGAVQISSTALRRPVFRRPTFSPDFLTGSPSTTTATMEDQQEDVALGKALGQWASGLDHTDEAVWAIMRFEDVLLGERLSEVFLRLNLLRRQLAPRLSVSQVLALDRLLDEPAWRSPEAELSRFSEAYQQARTWNRRDPIPAAWSIPTVGRNAIPWNDRARIIGQVKGALDR